MATDLLRRAQAGDADAFGEIYRQHMPAIYRFISYRVADRQDAEDLTGKVFLRAWEALPRFEERQVALSAWLYRIARNVVIDYYRTSRRQAPLDEAAAEAIPGDEGPDAEEMAEVAQVRAAVGQLPEEQQSVVLLRFVEGLGHAEVAEAMGKSEGACRMLQHRALKALARLLGER